MVVIVVLDKLLVSHLVPQGSLVLMPILIIFASCAGVLLVAQLAM